MSQTSKEKKKTARAAAKRARKTANYLKNGPKEGHTTKSRQRYGRFKPGTPLGPKTLDKPSSETKRKRRSRKLRPGKTKKYAKLPLRPLRKRRHLNIPARQKEIVAPVVEASPTLEKTS
jgi:hypothetical protein